jgi:hypothetical protein
MNITKLNELEADAHSKLLLSLKNLRADSVPHLPPNWNKKCGQALTLKNRL